MTAESLDVELSVPLGMSRMYLADWRMANALFREVTEDDEDEDDEGEEADDEEYGEGYSE